MQRTRQGRFAITVLYLNDKRKKVEDRKLVRVFVAILIVTLL